MEVLASGYGLAEAPRADAVGGVFFSDALGGGVYRWADGEIDTVVPKRRGVGGMALHADGGVVVGGRSVIHVAPDGTNRDIWALPDGVMGVNDLCALADGTVLVGALRFLPFAGQAPVPGSFFRVAAAGDADEVVDDVDWPNGCGQSLAGDLLYCCDYTRGILHVLDGATRTAISVPGGEADGLAVDDEAGIWIAQPKARRLVRLSPDGELDRTLDVGVAVTSLAFDGDVLYLTTLEEGGEPGALLRTEAPIPGPRHHLAAI